MPDAEILPSILRALMLVKISTSPSALSMRLSSRDRDPSLLRSGPDLSAGHMQEDQTDCAGK